MSSFFSILLSLSLVLLPVCGSIMEILQTGSFFEGTQSGTLHETDKQTTSCPFRRECSSCDKSCPMNLVGPSGGYELELTSCREGIEKLQERLENFGDSTLLEECSFDVCYTTRQKQACGIPINMKGTLSERLDEMQKLLKSKQAEEAKVTAEYVAKRAEYRSSPYYQYHSDLREMFKRVNRERELALKARSDNHELKSFVESYEFRKRKQEARRLKLESDEFGRHYRFWQKVKKRLFFAVQTSPRELRETRDELVESMLKYEADAELLGALRKAGGTKEKQVKLVNDIKQELQIQLEAAKSVNAQVKAEAAFIDKARDEIYNLLMDVLEATRKGERKVKCGENEVGNAVAQRLMAS